MSSGALSGATTINASSTITGGTITDGTASLSSGALTGITNITASGTITDGTASLASGALTGITNITASGTITDGTASLASGALSGITTLVVSDISLNSYLSVGEDASFNGDLYVAGTITDGTASLTSGALTGITDITASGTITDGTASLTSGALSGITTLVVSDISLNNNMVIAGDASFNNGVYIKENLVVDGALTVMSYNDQYIINTTTTDYTLIVAEDLSLNGRLLVNDDVSLNRNLYVAGTITDGTASLTSGALSGITTLIVSDISLNSYLSVGEDASFNGDLYVAGTITDGTASLTGGALTGATTISATTLLLSGDASFNGSTYFDGDISIKRQLLSISADINKLGTTWAALSISSNSSGFSSHRISSTGQYQVVIHRSDTGVNTSTSVYTPYYSTDYGASWSVVPGDTDPDLWTFFRVSYTGQYMLLCSVINYQRSPQKQPILIVSHDYGATWTTPLFVAYRWQYYGTPTIITDFIGTTQFIKFTTGGFDSIMRLDPTIDIGVDLHQSSQGKYRDMAAGGSLRRLVTTPNYELAMTASTVARRVGDVTTSGVISAAPTAVSLTGYPTADNAVLGNLAISDSEQYQVVVKYASSTGGLWLSSDYGVSWTQKLTIDVNNIALSPNGQYMIASSNNMSNIYKSDDYGSTWTQVTPDISFTGTLRSLQFTSDNSTVYACADYGWNSSVPTSGLYKNLLLSNIFSQPRIIDNSIKKSHITTDTTGTVNLSSLEIISEDIFLSASTTTITLPSIDSKSAGIRFNIKKTGSAIGNAFTINAYTGETNIKYQGGATKLSTTNIGAHISSVVVISDGFSWNIFASDSASMVPVSTPSSASDTGTPGQIAVDSGYIYICTATDTWTRTSLSTW